MSEPHPKDGAPLSKQERERYEKETAMYGFAGTVRLQNVDVPDAPDRAAKICTDCGTDTRGHRRLKTEDGFYICYNCAKTRQRKQRGILKKARDEVRERKIKERARDETYEEVEYRKIKILAVIAGLLVFIILIGWLAKLIT